jgi:hypothetical protein
VRRASYRFDSVKLVVAIVRPERLITTEASG